MITIHHKELLGGTVHAFTSPDVEGLFVTGPTKGAAYSELLATLRARGFRGETVEAPTSDGAEREGASQEPGGSSFEGFLREQGIFDEVDAEARRRVAEWLAAREGEALPAA